MKTLEWLFSLTPEEINKHRKSKTSKLHKLRYKLLQHLIENSDFEPVQLKKIKDNDNELADIDYFKLSYEEFMHDLEIKYKLSDIWKMDITSLEQITGQFLDLKDLRILAAKKLVKYIYPQNAEIVNDPNFERHFNNYNPLMNNIETFVGQIKNFKDFLTKLNPKFLEFYTENDEILFGINTQEVWETYLEVFKSKPYFRRFKHANAGCYDYLKKTFQIYIENPKHLKMIYDKYADHTIDDINYFSNFLNEKSQIDLIAYALTFYYQPFICSRFESVIHIGLFFDFESPNQLINFLNMILPTYEEKFKKDKQKMTTFFEQISKLKNIHPYLNEQLLSGRYDYENHPYYNFPFVNFAFTCNIPKICLENHNFAPMQIFLDFIFMYNLEHRITNQLLLNILNTPFDTLVNNLKIVTLLCYEFFYIKMNINDFLNIQTMNSYFISILSFCYIIKEYPPKHLILLILSQFYTNWSRFPSLSVQYETLLNYEIQAITYSDYNVTGRQLNENELGLYRQGVNIHNADRENNTARIMSNFLDEINIKDEDYKRCFRYFEEYRASIQDENISRKLTYVLDNASGLNGNYGGLFTNIITLNGQRYDPKKIIASLVLLGEQLNELQEVMVSLINSLISSYEETQDGRGYVVCDPGKIQRLAVGVLQGRYKDASGNLIFIDNLPQNKNEKIIIKSLSSIKKNLNNFFETLQMSNLSFEHFCDKLFDYLFEMAMFNGIVLDLPAVFFYLLNCGDNFQFDTEYNVFRLFDIYLFDFDQYYEAFGNLNRRILANYNK